MQEQNKKVDETEEEEIEQPEQEELPQHPDTDYLIKVFNHLKELGYINTQYEFSERFLNKNNHQMIYQAVRSNELVKKFFLNIIDTKLFNRVSILEIEHVFELIN